MDSEREVVVVVDDFRKFSLCFSVFFLKWKFQHFPGVSGLYKRDWIADNRAMSGNEDKDFYLNGPTVLTRCKEPLELLGRHRTFLERWNGRHQPLDFVRAAPTSEQVENFSQLMNIFLDISIKELSVGVENWKEIWETSIQ